MPADASQVDLALVGKLLADATLMAVLTHGVFLDVAPQGATKFAIVSQAAHADAYELGQSAMEIFTYLVKAVVLDTSGANVKTAAARIHTLLQDGTLTPTGYRLLLMARTERIAMTEGDADRRWQHRGGLYEIAVEPD